MSWSTSWLLLFASTLLVGFSDGQGICGDEIKNVTVREFITSLFDRMVGDWVVTYYWENQNKSYFPDTECVYYKQELNPKPNLLNLTQIQRYDNGTRTETPQLLKFKDSNYVDYYLKRDDPNAQVLEKRLLDYDLTAPEKKDRYIIVYACNQDGSNQPWKRFWTLTNRTDTYEESPAVNLATDQALGRVGLNRGLIKSLWNEDCAQQEWGEKSLPFAKTAPSTLESPTGTPISTTEEPKVSE